ncbi:hypothetical protein PVAND_013582 [Polypedilum vanderplanki]|uniref:Uncharacterized protein n=1 Tax=Polypedilum vanderplanki TaxID=319348 RepID=A0A9J6CS10_POLVA|nr:hypothetical protein PVAND_013582 [Polypedilum vanderplanki]
MIKNLFLILLLLKVVKVQENEDIVKIIDKIFKSDLSMELPSINLITTEKSYKEKLSSKIIEKLSKKKSMMILNEESLNKLKIEKLMFNIFIIKSLEGFKNLSKKITNKKFNYGGYYVIIFENGTKEDSHEIFTLLWEFYIHNINLLRKENNTIIVETFIPFQPSKCNQTEPVEIAKYKNGKFITKPENFFPLKFKNFHRCPIKVTTFGSLAPSVLRNNFPNGSYELYGRDVKVFRALEKEFNFYANVTYLTKYGSWGIIFENGTVTGAMGHATRREADFALGNLFLKLERVLIMGYSFGYYLETLVFAIPKGEPYSSFHKLLRPFDNIVWIITLVLIIVTFFIIIFLNFQSNKIKNFIFGEGIKHPTLNVVQALFGLSQHKLPTGDFARFLLMTFLIFCLIIRSLYQGSLYQFLQLSDNQPKVSSIEEMAEKNYTFYLIASFDDMTKDHQIMKYNRKVIAPSEFYTIMNNTLRPNFQGSNIIPFSELLYKNKMRALSNEDLYTMCKQIFTMIPISIYYPKDSYLVTTFDDLLIWFQSSGLISYWASQEMDYKYLSYNSDLDGPKVMSIEHLSGTFQIWIFLSIESYEFVEIIDEIVKTDLKIEISNINLIITETVYEEKLLSKIIEKLSKEKSVMILNEESLNKLKIEKLMFNIFIIKSLEGFKNLSKKITNKKFNYGGYYVIIFENGTKEDSHEIFTLLWEFYIHNINLLRRENNTIIVETFIPFQPSKCNQTEPVEIAKYKNGKFITKPGNFFPQKYENFHKCPLKITTFASLAPSVLRNDFPNGSYELYGRDVKVFRALEKEFNFYANVTYLTKYGSWGIIFENGTVTGAMGQATRREADFALGNLNLKLDRALIMGYSFGYYLETLVFVIPKGEPYSSFHKLLRPFENAVWIAMLVLILLTFIIIILLTFQPERIKNFVIGVGINHPSLNVLQVLFGLSQHKLPSRNFARFLLMTFLIFCLVIRSLYQGSLYQFLQLSDNQPEVSSIEEMAERGYTFYMIASYDDMTKDNAAMKNRRKIIPPSELYTIMNSTIRPNFHGSNIIAFSEVLYKNKLRARSKEDLYTVCKQIFTMIPISIYYPKDSYLVTTFDDLLIWFQSSGLISYWASQEMDYKYLSYNSDLDGPKVMSIEHFDIVEVTSEIIESAFHQRQVTAVTFIDATLKKSLEIHDFINELLTKIGSQHIYERINLQIIKTAKFTKRLNSNVIIISSMNEFRNFTKILTHKIFNYGGYYIILFKNATHNEAHEIFQTLWDFYIYNLNLIRNVNDSVVVETFIPFQLGKCNKTDPVVIANYQNGKFKLKSDDFFPLKFQNFYKCPLKFTTYESLAPSVIRNDFPNGTLHLHGRDVDTYTTLSETLNFKLDMFYIAEYGGWGYYNQNGTVTGGMARAIRRETEFILGNNNLKYDRALAMSHTYGYYLETLVFMLPPAEELSSFHKLIQPFDNYVWSCIIFILIVAIIVIGILEYQSIKVRSFVYGKNIKNPYMNILIAIVGGSQVKLPKRNFSRSLLMMFLLFCIIIRSSYQGALYKALQQNDLIPEPQNVEEIAERNLTFYVLVSWDELTINNSAIRNRRKMIQPLELQRMMNDTLKKDFNGALMTVLSEVLYRNKLRSLQGMELFKVCKQFYTMIPIVMYMPKNSYLVDPFNMKLLWFESAGLITWWQSNYGDMTYLADPTDFLGPKSLKISHLSATFQIYLCCCLTGFIIFIFELIFNQKRVDFIRKKLGIKRHKKKIVMKKLKPLLKSKTLKW